MAPKDQTEFPAAAQEYRDARDRCAAACRNYNLQPEPNNAEARSTLYNL
jgi:hypothetical protein